MNDDHMPNASKPHVLCDAQNLVINPAQTLPAACPRHRPKYLCTFGETYNHYLPGAFGLACKSDPIKLEDFPHDHLQDIMESMATVAPDDATQVNMLLASCGLADVSWLLRSISSVSSWLPCNADTGHQVCLLTSVRSIGVHWLHARISGHHDNSTGEGKAGRREGWIVWIPAPPSPSVMLVIR